MLARREQFHQSRLVEHLGSWNPFYNDNLSRIQAYLNGRAATGSSSGTSVAIVGQTVQSQVTILAYIDVFVALGLIAAVMVPLALTLRSVNRAPVQNRRINYSILSLASCTTLPHLSISTLMRWPNSSGVSATAVKPSWSGSP